MLPSENIFFVSEKDNQATNGKRKTVSTIKLVNKSLQVTLPNSGK